ncbi:MAG: VWA domain-containing protein [Desulfotalea sp.]
MRILYPEALLLLLLLPVLAYLLSKRGPRPALKFSSTSLVAQLSTVKKAPGKTALYLRLLALTFIIIALARPQLGNTYKEVEASGIDILLAVDISGSMKAMDFTLDGKRTNRLDVVKNVVKKFIEERPNDRISLIAFAGRPYVVCPLTLDHNWLLERLNNIQIGMVKENGTAVGSAIGSGVNRLRDKDAKSRIMIVLTDGVSNVGKVSPLIAAEAAKSYGVKVYTIGAGTRGVAPFPTIDPFGRTRLVQRKVDIDEKTLTEVANITSAKYFRATDTKSLENIYAEINKMETTTRKTKQIENYRELFLFPLALALILLAIELTKRKRLP